VLVCRTFYRCIYAMRIQINLLVSLRSLYVFYDPDRLLNYILHTRQNLAYIRQTAL
jgi:hypothetical protein